MDVYGIMITQRAPRRSRSGSRMAANLEVLAGGRTA